MPCDVSCYSMSESRSDTVRRLPPLSMLRSFEAAARHGSMSRAASELNVTHGAISRQIASLEKLLESNLFVRKARGVQLTEQGTRFFHGVFSGFERIRAAVDDLRSDRRRRPITVTTTPTLAGRWLMPRLAEFQRLHPKVIVNVRTKLELEDLADPSIDFAIRYGGGNWPNTTSELLISVNSYPVCSPSFLAAHGPFHGPEDLLQLPLIHDVTRQWWIDWLLAAGMRIEDLSGGIVVDEYGLAIQFALDGYGVAMARDALVQRELESGTLVRLFEVSVIPRFAVYLARDAARPLTRDAQLLIPWLKTKSSWPSLSFSDHRSDGRIATRKTTRRGRRPKTRLRGKK
jgi:LysR family glycine cleavage system transcriptional activator